MTEFDTRPSTLTARSAVASALLVAVVAAIASVSSAGIALIGVVLVALFAHRGSTAALDIGALALFVASVHLAIQSSSIGLALVGALGAVLAWDFGHTSRDIGRQLGREAPTRRLEVVRVLSSLSVGLVSVALGALVYVAARGVDSNAALVALILTVLFVTVALGTGVRAVRTGDGGVYRRL